MHFFVEENDDKCDYYFNYIACDKGKTINKFGLSGKELQMPIIKEKFADRSKYENTREFIREMEFILQFHDITNDVPMEVMEIAGVIFDAPEGSGSILSVDDKYHDSIIGDYGNKYSMLVAIEKISADDVAGILKLYKGNRSSEFDEDGVLREYDLNNKSVAIYESLRSFMIGWNNFILIAIIIGAIAILLLSNFISASVMSQKREIGILRAIGATKADTLKIFSLEGIFVCLTSAVIALAFVIRKVTAFELNFHNMYQFDVNVFRFGVVEIGVLIAVALVGGFISSFIPIFRIAKKKPIDAINNN